MSGGGNLKGLRKGLAAAAAALLLLGGCAFPQSGVESLLAAPRLSEEQSEIYSALVRETGNDIKLLYPQRGENRSAFLVINLDEEATDEAVAFYQSTSVNVTSSIHMAVLDKLDGEWRSVHDISLEGSQVEDASVMREGGSVLLAVGLTYSSDNASLLKIYSFNGRTMDEMYSESYQAKIICDMDGDDRDDVVLVSSGTEEVSAFAKLLVYEDGHFLEKGRAITDPTITRYSSILSGYLKNGQRAVYLDAYRGSTAMTTEILAYAEDSGGYLMNLTYDALSVKSYPVDRSLGAESVDLNNDSVIEVPGLTAMPGYEADQAGAFFLTTWYNFLDGEYQKVKSSYVNASQGYMLDFPAEWEGRVSVRKSAQSNETLFYEYQEGDNPVKSELLYIQMVKRSDWESSANYSGYEVISSSGGGQIVYLARIPAGADPALRMTMEEVKKNFSRYY